MFLRWDVLRCFADTLFSLRALAGFSQSDRKPRRGSQRWEGADDGGSVSVNERIRRWAAALRLTRTSELNIPSLSFSSLFCFSTKIPPHQWMPLIADPAHRQGTAWSSAQSGHSLIRHGGVQSRALTLLRVRQDPGHPGTSGGTAF